MKLLSGLPTLGARDRRALRLGAWALVPLLIAGAIIRPYVTSLLDHREALASERALLVREYRAVQELANDRRALAALDSELVSLAPRLFSGADVVTASAELGRYANEEAAAAGLHVAQVETESRIDSTPVARLGNDGSGPERAQSASDLRVSLRARGDIVAIHEFLQAIEAGSKLVRVERIQIVRPADGDGYDGALSFTALLAGRARSGLGPNFVTTAEDSP